MSDWRIFKIGDMTLAKRIIPCLDVKGGRTVKGTRFEQLWDCGDIVELSVRYAEQGADELVFLDIAASGERRRTRVEWVEEVARHIAIPFTVGGGVASERDVERLLRSGADKVAVNTAALAEPGLIGRLAEAFGRQCVVVAVDARPYGGLWEVYSHGGSRATGWELADWVREAEAQGAGEILFTSVEHDGTGRGYACEEIAKLTAWLGIPLIASGGAGRLEDFGEVFERGHADAALAAGVFHSGQMTVPEVKAYLREKNIVVR